MSIEGAFKVCFGSGMKRRSSPKVKLTPQTIKRETLQPNALSIISVRELKPLPRQTPKLQKLLALPREAPLPLKQEFIKLALAGIQAASKPANIILGNMISMNEWQKQLRAVETFHATAQINKRRFLEYRSARQPYQSVNAIKASLPSKVQRLNYRM